MHSYNVGGELRYVNSNSLFGKNNSFVMGFQPRYGDQRQDRYVNINGSIGALTNSFRAKSTYFGAYAEDAFDATKDFTIVVGGRWDYTTRQATVDNYGPAGNPFNPATPSTLTGTQRPLQHFDAINPKLGFVYRTTQTSQLYFNASRAYEAPINIELLSSFNANGSPNTGFLNLDAQRAWQLELGHRGTSADKRYSWDVTVYNLEMQKELLTTIINNTGTFQNANGTRHTGVEAGGGMVLKKGLFVQGGAGKEDSLQTRVAYTWSRFKFTDDVRGGGIGGPNVLIAKAGNTVAGAPEHSLNVEARYDHPAGWWIAPNIEWSMSGFYTDYLNTIKNPSYFVVNLRSGYTINDHWILFAEGRNLTDKTYAGAVVVNDQFNRFANAALGISGFAGVEYKF
jgi:iron complex outermembrane receptor protein